MEEAICRITLNRPEKRNALSSALCREVLAKLDRAEADSSVRVILLSGDGPAFCAGMDLEEALQADQSQLAELHERLFTIIARLRKPMIAAVHGAALAGGLGLAANAHIVIASPDARFGLTEIRIGLWPVIIFRAMVRAIGERRTTELSLTGRIFGAEEALQFGLVSEIAPNPLARALEVAGVLSEFSPSAMAAGLEYADQIRGLDWSEVAPTGHATRETLMRTPEFLASTEKLLEKRHP